MELHQLPVSMSHRPTRVSPEAAEQALFDALTGDSRKETKRDYFESKWIELLSVMGDDDQLWMFETSGLGASKRRGVAREHCGQVVDILMFP